MGQGDRPGFGIGAVARLTAEAVGVAIGIAGEVIRFILQLYLRLIKNVL